MASAVSHCLSRLAELRAIAEWKLLHHPIYRRDEAAESADVKECWRLLALTSRSFVAVIQQLHPELLPAICVFYLALRGLDTVEDDMTIPIAKKEPLLRAFHRHLHDETWTFNDSGPNEEHREVLVKFDVVSRQYNTLKDDYRHIINDITRRMGYGMADYAVHGDSNGVKTVKDYELYCHYVAGLVGEGVTRMFVVAKLADLTVMQNPELAESMAQLLQQTNVIRDVHEDHADGRHFWPQEIWSKHVDKFADLFQPDPHSRERALECSSEMVLLAIERAPECLAYMSRVQEQSIFNFVAIPQTMAIATLELCFQNPAIFERNIKISKGLACRRLIESTKDIRHVCQIFRDFAKRIQNKNNPHDPNYNRIDTACQNISRTVNAIISTAKAPYIDQTIATQSKLPHTATLGIAVLVAFGAVAVYLDRSS